MKLCVSGCYGRTAIGSIQPSTPSTGGTTGEGNLGHVGSICSSRLEPANSRHRGDTPSARVVMVSITRESFCIQFCSTILGPVNTLHMLTYLDSAIQIDSTKSQLESLVATCFHSSTHDKQKKHVEKVISFVLLRNFRRFSRPLSLVSFRRYRTDAATTPSKSPPPKIFSSAWRVSGAIEEAIEVAISEDTSDRAYFGTSSASCLVMTPAIVEATKAPPAMDTAWTITVLGDLESILLY